MALFNKSLTSLFNSSFNKHRISWFYSFRKYFLFLRNNFLLLWLHLLFRHFFSFLQSWWHLFWKSFKNFFLRNRWFSLSRLISWLFSCRAKAYSWCELLFWRSFFLKLCYCCYLSGISSWNSYWYWWTLVKRESFRESFGIFWRKLFR